MRQVHWSSIVFTVGVTLAAPAAVLGGGIPTFDAIQNTEMVIQGKEMIRQGKVLKEQVDTAREAVDTAKRQLQEAENLYNSLTGISGFGDILREMDRMHEYRYRAAGIKEELCELVPQEGFKINWKPKVSASNLGDIEDVLRCAGIDEPEETVGMAAAAADQHNTLQHEARVQAHYQVRGEEGYEMAEQRRPALSALKTALGGATEMKQVMDLQAETLIEIAHLLNDQVQLTSTLVQMIANFELLKTARQRSQ